MTPRASRRLPRRKRPRHRPRSTRSLRQHLLSRSRQSLLLLFRRVGPSSWVHRKVQLAASAQEVPAHPLSQEKLQLFRLPRWFRPVFPIKPRSFLRSLQLQRRANHRFRPLPLPRLRPKQWPHRHSPLAEPTLPRNQAVEKRRLCWGSQQQLWSSRVSIPDGTISKDAQANPPSMCQPFPFSRPRRRAAPSPPPRSLPRP